MSGGIAVTRSRGGSLLTICLALTLLPLTVGSAAGQSPDTGTWVGIGAGAATPLGDWAHSDPAFAGVLELAHRRGGHLFSTRAMVVAELLGDSFYDFGLLYGRQRRVSFGYLSASAGIGTVLGPHGSAESKEATLGIPFELRARGRLSSFLGLSVQGFGNLNRRQRLLGATVSVQLGQVP